MGEAEDRILELFMSSATLQAQVESLTQQVGRLADDMRRVYWSLVGVIITFLTAFLSMVVS